MNAVRIELTGGGHYFLLEEWTAFGKETGVGIMDQNYFILVTFATVTFQGFL